VQAAGEKSVLIRTKDLSEKERQELITTASLGEKTQIVRFSSYGPSIGAELRSNSIWAIFTVLIGIMLYVAYAFRQVSKPVSSWMYGLITVIALAHDVIIPAGIYIMLSARNIGVEIDVLFVTALLTVLGFSVHDTIVVFDRTREHLRSGVKESFETTVGKSVSQTFTRSINTSLTVLIVIGALYLFGGETTKYFAFTLGIGVIIGTYSSIFIGSPLLVTMANFIEKRKR
jgi:preprotein translocase subunit SecF